jgi:PAS domain S-box-containing protein
VRSTDWRSAIRLSHFHAAARGNYQAASKAPAGRSKQVRTMDPKEENRLLKRCVNDLVGVLALPTLWANGGPNAVLRTLIDALQETLNLDFVCARLTGLVGDPPIEMCRAHSACVLAAGFDGLWDELAAVLGPAPQDWPGQAHGKVGGRLMRIVLLRIGAEGDAGVVIVGSERDDFPRQTEDVVLAVAANQAALGLQKAQLLSERSRAEAALRARDDDLRLIVDSIPGLVCTISANGDGELFNRQVLQYFGRTSEELRAWRKTDVVHPDDRPRLAAAFKVAVADGQAYDIEVRCRRGDGIFRWFQALALPSRNADGQVERWYVLLTDIHDRKHAEEAVKASERNLAQIINTIRAVVWSARPDGTPEFLNRHYLDYVGVRPEDAREWDWADAIHPDDVQGLGDTWRGLLAAGIAGEAQARMRRYDGEYRWFLFRANPLRDESGAIIKWHGTSIDIEDRKRAEDELRRNEAFLAEGQRLSSTGSFAWRTDSDEIAFSDELYRIFGFERDEPVTLQSVSSRIHRDDMPMVTEQLRRARADGADLEFEARLQWPNGPTKYARALAHGVRRDDGRLEYVGAIQDVTQRRLSEEALNKARSDLARVARITTIGALTASIAHEVNQPLSGILTNASTCLRMLAMDPPNVDVANEAARRTTRDAHRALDVIKRLRALFGSGKGLSDEAVNINEAAQEVIALSLSELQRARVSIRLEFADDLPKISGDRVQIQQVIMNLLLNAADAMSGIHDRPRHLIVRTELEDGERVRLSVKDAGVGFDQQSAERLFEAFYTTKAGGMGIGLSISRSIIETHHGQIWAKPNEGHGATFGFSIPRQREPMNDQSRS